MNFISESIDTPCTNFLWPSKVYTLLYLFPPIFHNMAVPSRDPETRWLESFDQQRSITSPTWPLNYLGCPHYMTSSSFPNSAGTDFKDHIITIWSSDPDAKYWPLGENLTTLIVELCPPCRSYLYSGFHFLIVDSLSEF